VEPWWDGIISWTNFEEMVGIYTSKKIGTETFFTSVLRHVSEWRFCISCESRLPVDKVCQYLPMLLVAA
jgi:hypothetical protein